LGDGRGERKSKKWKYYQKILNREYTRKKNKLKNWIHETTTFFLKNCRANTIIIGHLAKNFKEMVKKKGGTGKTWKNNIKKGSNKQYQNMGYALFYHILQWKAKRFGKRVFFIDESNTSKRCCQCQNKKEDLKLSDRKYICEKCGLDMDRDRNSALNILFRFLECKSDEQKAKKNMLFYDSDFRNKQPRQLRDSCESLSSKPSVAEAKFRKEIRGDSVTS
jgi:putative transposase